MMERITTEDINRQVRLTDVLLRKLDLYPKTVRYYNSKTRKTETVTEDNLVHKVFLDYYAHRAFKYCFQFTQFSR